MSAGVGLAVVRGQRLGRLGRDRLLHLGDLNIGGPSRRRLRRARHLRDRCPPGRVAVQRRAVDVVEEREELVIILGADRVVLVVVAAGTAGGQAQEDGSVGIDLVDDVADIDFLFDRAPLAGRDVAAVEAGGDHLVGRRIGQQVAGELFDDEPVERLVGVEGVDDPVAIGPGLAIVVEVQAVGVAIAGGVEPESRHVLAIAGRVEQAVDDLFVSLCATCRPGTRRPLRGSAAGRSGRASRGESASVLAASGDGESPSASSRARMNRSISLIGQPAFLTVGKRGLCWGIERPVRRPRGPLLDPPAQQWRPGRR